MAGPRLAPRNHPHLRPRTLPAVPAAAQQVGRHGRHCATKAAEPPAAPRTKQPGRRSRRAAGDQPHYQQQQQPAQEAQVEGHHHDGGSSSSSGSHSSTSAAGNRQPQQDLTQAAAAAAAARQAPQQQQQQDGGVTVCCGLGRSWGALSYWWRPSTRVPAVNSRQQGRRDSSSPLPPLAHDAAAQEAPAAADAASCACTSASTGGLGVASGQHCTTSCHLGTKGPFLLQQAMYANFMPLTSGAPMAYNSLCLDAGTGGHRRASALWNGVWGWSLWSRALQCHSSVCCPEACKAGQLSVDGPQCCTRTMWLAC